MTKSPEVKAHALELFLDGMPMYKICKAVGVAKLTLYKWKDKYEWSELFEEAAQRRHRRVTERVIKKQEGNAELACLELQKRLKEQEKSSETLTDLQRVLGVTLANKPHKSADDSELNKWRKDLSDIAKSIGQFSKMLMDNRDLINMEKHGLEVVRPKQTTNNLNITKSDNKTIQVNIPKEVTELLKENA